MLREEGVRVEEKVEEEEDGKFAWIYDPDGNKIKLLNRAKKLYNEGALDI